VFAKIKPQHRSTGVDCPRRGRRLWLRYKTADDLPVTRQAMYYQFI